MHLADAFIQSDLHCIQVSFFYILSALIILDYLIYLILLSNNNNNNNIYYLFYIIFTVFISIYKQMQPLCA